MTTIGDGFLIALTIFGLFITAWATSVSIMLLFPKMSERARSYAEETPFKAIGLGILLVLLIGFPGVVLLGAGPLAKLAGWIVVLGLLSIAAVGTSGIAQAAGYRISQLDSSMTAYHAMARGAGFVVGATILPLLGWFFFGPLLLFASLGAGWKAVGYMLRQGNQAQAA